MSFTRDSATIVNCHRRATAIAELGFLDDAAERQVLRWTSRFPRKSQRAGFDRTAMQKPNSTCRSQSRFNRQHAGPNGGFWPRPEIPGRTGKLLFYAIRSRPEAMRLAWKRAPINAAESMSCLASSTSPKQPNPRARQLPPAQRLRCGAEGARQTPKSRPARQISGQRR